MLKQETANPRLPPCYLVLYLVLLPSELTLRCRCHFPGYTIASTHGSGGVAPQKDRKSLKVEKVIPLKVEKVIPIPRFVPS